MALKWCQWVLVRFRPRPKTKPLAGKALAFVGTSGVQIGWLASQADMLADDWKIVE